VDVNDRDTDRRREQRSWAFYDWANSAYATTVAAVFLGPYLTELANRGACPDGADPCLGRLDLFGVAIAPGSFFSYAFAFSIVVQIFFIPWLGAIADRSERKKTLLGLFAYLGSAATIAMFLLVDGRWLLGGLLFVIANLCFSSSMVVYNSFLPQISEPDERDTVSNRGWALGYLGGGLLLFINLIMYTFHEALGLSAEGAVRLALVSAGVWWAFFTIIPLRGLRNRPPVAVERTSSVVQLVHTLRHMRAFPMTLLFLIAYLFYNDGIQSVLAMASVYGSQELKLDQNVLISAILLVQFVAFFGNLFLLRLSRRFGPKETVVGALVVWTLLTLGGYFIAEGAQFEFYALAVGFGLVMGGSQALSRSIYAQMIPKGSEAQYYSVYELSERGTSWLGALIFGLVNQMTDSYRLALLSLVLFFMIGIVLLVKVDVRRAIADAGNPQPAKV
jgi:UMF1 family MFS transporter